jgi:hypothetical protein
MKRVVEIATKENSWLKGKKRMYATAKVHPSYPLRRFRILVMLVFAVETASAHEWLDPRLAALFLAVEKSRIPFFTGSTATWQHRSIKGLYTAVVCATDVKPGYNAAWPFSPFDQSWANIHSHSTRQGESNKAHLFSPAVLRGLREKFLRMSPRMCADDAREKKMFAQNIP